MAVGATSVNINIALQMVNLAHLVSSVVYPDSPNHVFGALWGYGCGTVCFRAQLLNAHFQFAWCRRWRDCALHYGALPIMTSRG